MIEETLLMADINARDHPALLQACVDAECARPPVSALAAVDWHEEHLTTKKFDSKNFANEWDGVVAFVPKGSELSCFLEMSKRASPSQLSMKAYLEVVSLAKSKFPALNWDMESTVDSRTYLAKYREVMAAIKDGAPRVRGIDTVVAEIIQGQENMSTCKGEEPNSYEIFRDLTWETSVDFKGLCLYIKQRLGRFFC